MDPLQTNLIKASINDEDETSLLDILLIVVENIKLLIIGPIIAGLVALGYAFTITPVFTAKTTFIPPASSNVGGGAAAMILGQLGGLGGMISGGPTSAGKHIAYLDSDLLRDELIKKFDLQKRWGHRSLNQTRQALKGATVVKDDKKSGLVSIEFTNEDPRFAAEIANAYVFALSEILGNSAIEDARSRRELLERQITEATRRSYQSPQVRDALIQGLVREFETTRLVEQQPNPNIVQVDVAEPPDFRSGPKKALMAVIASLTVGFLLLLFVFLRSAVVNANGNSESREKLKRIQRAIGLSTKTSK